MNSAVLNYFLLAFKSRHKRRPFRLMVVGARNFLDAIFFIPIARLLSLPPTALPLFPGNVMIQAIYLKISIKKDKGYT